MDANRSNTGAAPEALDGHPARRTSARVRTLVVGHDDLSRRRWFDLLSEVSEIEVLPPTDSAIEALRAIRSGSVELAILEVTLPDLDAFEVLELARAAGHRPEVILYSRRPADGVRAFEVDAADFLVPPLSVARVLSAIGRAAARCRVTVDRPPHRSGAVRRIVARVGHRFIVVPVDRVIRIEGERNYVRVTTDRDSYRIRATLLDMEARLGPDQFCRIHRSTVVALRSIREIRTTVHGDLRATLCDGTELTVTRSRRESFLRALGHVASVAGAPS